MAKTHKSFIREILKVTEDPRVISFAGGLPNPNTFPVQQVAEASKKVLAEDGENTLQYSTTEGCPPLREYIADRYLTRKNCLKEEEFDCSRGFLYNQWTRRGKILYVNV